MKKNIFNKFIFSVVTFLLTLTFTFSINSFADGDEEETLTRLGVGLNHSAIVEPDGSLLMWGDGRDGQLGIDSAYETLPKLVLKNVKYVAIGYNTTAVIKNDDTLWTKAKGHEKFEVEKNEGSLKIGKGLTQGTYTVKIKVTAKGNENYKAITKTIDVPVVIE